MTKKRICLPLLICLLLYLCAGCGEPATTGGGVQPAPSTTAQTDNPGKPAEVDPTVFTQSFHFAGLTLKTTAAYQKTQETPSMMELASDHISIWVQQQTITEDSLPLKELAEKQYSDTKTLYEPMGLGTTVTFAEGDSFYYFTVTHENLSNGICIAYYQTADSILEIRATYQDAALSEAEALYILTRAEV